MLPLSQRTERLLRATIQKSAERSRVSSLLETEVGQNLPFCEERTAVEMERIRFAVIRLIVEDSETASEAVDLAKTDWRDLLMAAEFGHRVEAHLDWFRSATGEPP
ncbi:MAG: hypothetical protein AAGG01_18175 [Planctomycetota bacterium]